MGERQGEMESLVIDPGSAAAADPGPDMRRLALGPICGRRRKARLEQNGRSRRLILYSREAHRGGHSEPRRQMTFARILQGEQHGL
jgi:hypothetical protein